MSMLQKIRLVVVLGLIGFCLVMAFIKGQIPGMTPPGGSSSVTETAVLERETLAQARSGFKTQLVVQHSAAEDVENPGKPLRQVEYPTRLGPMAAYITGDPGGSKRCAAIIWIAGGDCNTIGDVWSPARWDNDQTASAYRSAGIVMMFPSLRGGNKNPGSQESFYGEVDDVLAAREYLAKLPYVDPSRIYLGGHSTGGTLALLVSECSGVFRAVFCFGPVSRVTDYSGGLSLYCNTSDDQEVKVRSPIYWLNSIKSPTYVMEGGEGNVSSLEEMSQMKASSPVHFLKAGAFDHFSLLAPANWMMAKKINQDTGATCNIAISAADVAGLK